MNKSSIKPEQWEMPVSFRPDGVPVTLREFAEHKTPALSLSSLNQNQRAELTAQRIEKQSEFELGMVGHGEIGKEQAIAEVRAQTPIGLTLIEIETRAIIYLIEDARQS